MHKLQLLGHQQLKTDQGNQAVIAIITLKIMRWVNRHIHHRAGADSCLRINQVNIAAPPSATSAVSHSASWTSAPISR